MMIRFIEKIRDRLVHSRNRALIEKYKIEREEQFV